MRTPHRFAAVLVAALALLLGLTMPASAHGKKPQVKTNSVATLLAKDGAGFDRDRNDFDIADNAVAAVLGAKPGSQVAVLADGSTPLTVFLPTDRAFQQLATELTGKRYESEQAVFTALVTTLGVDTIEDVLLYHVVPGATITFKQARHSDGAVLTTALAGSTITVDVSRGNKVSLVDADTNDRDARVVRHDKNKGNLQIVHGIDQVLRPVDLP